MFPSTPPKYRIYYIFEAILELYRVYSTELLNKEAEVSRKIAVAVCCIEAPCMMLIGLGTLLGLYGPYAVPVQIANAVYGALQGAGILSTFILGLHLSEECRIVKGEGLQRRPIFEEHRKVITVVSVLTLGADLCCMPTSVFCYYLMHRLKPISVSLMVLYTVFQGIAGCFFISHSVTVKQPMLEYLRNVRAIGTVNSQSRRKIGHLSFWLSASAVIMVLASIGMLFSSIFMIQGIRDWGVSTWSCVVFYVVFARVLVGAAQVNDVRPVDATVTLQTLLVLVLLRPIKWLLNFNAFSYCKWRRSVKPYTTSDNNTQHNIETQTVPSNSKWKHFERAPGSVRSYQ